MSQTPQPAYYRPATEIDALMPDIADPVAAHFGFPDIVATELQITDDRFTGEVTGTCCVGLGKLKHMLAYCTTHDVEAADVWYYGDSVADIPVLSAVGHPVAVNYLNHGQNRHLVGIITNVTKGIVSLQSIPNNKTNSPKNHQEEAIDIQIANITQAKIELIW